MKKIVFISTLFSLYTGITMATPLQYATEQTISAINIATLQHTITQNAFSSLAIPTPQEKSYHHLQKQIYGSMVLYGEYNDDGNIGRNGGDTQTPLINAWANWQYTHSDIAPDNFNRFNSRYHIATLGISGPQKQTKRGHKYNWNFYGGYINGTSRNKDLTSDDNGGFVGLHNKLHFQDIIINTTINAGALKSGTKYITLTDDHANIWFGAGTNIAYKLNIDKTFFIYPNISIAYTWVKNQTDNTAYGNELKNHSFGFFEISPAIQAIKHIGSDWYGTLGLRQIIHSSPDHKITLDNQTHNLPTIGDYTEYALTLEKLTDTFHFKINIGRHDGSVSGWTGGINIKYIF